MLVGVPIPATTGITVPPVTNAGTLEKQRMGINTKL